MDETQTLQQNFDEIKGDWQDSSLDEKQNYVLELDEMEARAIEIQSIRGTSLVRDVGLLRDHIGRQILPGQQKRNVDSRLADEKLPGERL